MPSASATKASDKTQACKKLTTILQKEYGKSVPSLKLPVLESMLFAVCLEDNPWDKALAGYEKLLKSYFDLNEIRVSSVGELEQTLSDLKNAEWKGLRIRSILRYVFESTYSFDFEKLSRLTVESAQKRLKKIDYLSPFVSNFTLQHVLGSHVVCLDHLSHRAAIHLGIVPPDSTIVEASDFLKSGVKKADAFSFGILLRKFSTDPKFEARVEEEYDDESEFDVLRVEDRLAVLKAPRKRKKKKPVEPEVAKKQSKATKKKTASAKSAKETSKKSEAKKPAKATTRKAAPKAAAPKKKAAAKKKKAAPPKKKTAAPKKKAAAKKKAPAKATASKKKTAKKKTAAATKKAASKRAPKKKK